MGERTSFCISIVFVMTMLRELAGRREMPKANNKTEKVNEMCAIMNHMHYERV